MSKGKKIDIDALVKGNPKVDAGELAKNLQVLQELARQGVNVGANYRLGSPFARREASDKTREPESHAIPLRHALP